MADMFRLDDKVAVVIGGAGGIGEPMALGLSQQGAKVAIASRNLPNLEQAAQKIQAETKSETTAFQVDITNEESIAQLAKQVLSKFGTVDILVNTQGTNLKYPATEFPVAEWDQMFNVNVKGTMLACREFGKVLIEKKKGKIIVGIIDRNSFLGKFYQKKKSVFYKQANFFAVKEVEVLLREKGFTRFSYYQTLFKLPDEITTIEKPKKGFGRGGFVVICAEK